MQDTKTAKPGFKIALAHKHFLFSGKTSILYCLFVFSKKTIRVVSLITGLFIIEFIIKFLFLLLIKPQKDSEIRVRKGVHFYHDNDHNCKRKNQVSDAVLQWKINWEHFHYLLSHVIDLLFVVFEKKVRFNTHFSCLQRVNRLFSWILHYFWSLLVHENRNYR